MASVFAAMSKLLAKAAFSGLSGLVVKLCADVWITCNCASKREEWITRFPSASFVSNRTSVFPVAEVEGAVTVTASRRKDLMPVPNLRSASSAASSAACIFWRLRFAVAAVALERRRETREEASFTISAGRESGRDVAAVASAPPCVCPSFCFPFSLSPPAAPSGNANVGSENDVFAAPASGFMDIFFVLSTSDF